jgi:exodeoxyribonuclease-3
VKILTYNLNGIRAALTKDLTLFLEREQADIVCFQEIKAHPDQFDSSVFEQMGYFCYWYPAEKKGYSGVAILSKIKPSVVEYGCQHALYDYEGRVIRADFEGFSVMSVYFPSGSSGDHRQVVKMEFLDFFYHYIQELRNKVPALIICGDYNICHQAIDIHDPIGNKNSSGFLPEEREWMSAFFSSGYTDTFRHLHPDALHRYTWWSFRANARNNNKGWRIDYIAIDKSLLNQLKSAAILPDDRQSDHCASYIEIDL